MADSLSIYTTTFNCARELPNSGFFSVNLFNALSTNLPPDLVVLSLQEIAPLGYAFLGGSLLAPYFSRFDDIVHSAAVKKFGADVKYETLAVRNVGLTGIMVFVRQDVAKRVRWMRTAGAGAGVMEMGNKGAVGVRIALGAERPSDGEQDAVLTFVAAHLAPHEPAWERRNADWKAICENLVFERDGGSTSIQHDQAAAKGGEAEHVEETAPLLSSDNASPSNTDDEDKTQHTLFYPPTHIFFLGDLNYRTSDSSPSPDAYQSYPKFHYKASDRNDYSTFLASDQLTREREAKRTLHNLTEAPITFLPTYKFSSAAQHQVRKQNAFYKDSTDEELQHREESELAPAPDTWARHRWPSWCDRVLYLSIAADEYNIHAYDALPIQETSDHRPVALSVSIPFEVVKGAVKAPFSVREDWKERRAGARRLERIVGAAAYAGWTWEGEALTLGTVVGFVGGWLALRALVGGS